jgi:PAS domain S-box-containing protein
VCIFITIAWITSFLSSIIKITGENLQQREALFRGLFDTMPSGSAIYRVSRDDAGEYRYTIEDMNETALRYEGKKKEDVIGKTLSESNQTTYSDSLLPKIREISLQDTPVLFSYSGTSDKQGTIYYENSLFKLPSREIVAIFTDVTEKKQVEKQLEKDEEMYRLAMEATSDGLWDWNMHTGEVYYSPSFAAILGEKFIEPRFESWESRLHPDDKERVLHSLREHGEGKTERWREENRLLTSDGEWRWVLERGSVVTRDETGTPLRMIGTTTDITEQKRIEEIIRSERDRAEQYLNIAEVIILALARDGTIALINRKGAEVLGRPAEEIIGLDWFESFIPPDLRDSVRKYFFSIIEGDETPYLSYTNEIVTSDGQTATISWVNTLIKSSNGQIMGTLSSGEDITRQKNLEQEKIHLIEQIQQNMAQIAYLNDNIRNPLTIIMALTEGYLEPEKTRIIHNQIDIIDTSITRLDQQWSKSEKVLIYLRKHYQISV